MHDTRTIVAQATDEYRPGLFTAEALRPEVANRTRAGRMLTAGTDLFEQLRQGQTLDRHRLRDAMTSAFEGRTDADGAWSWKDAYDAAEAAVVLFIREFGEKLIGPPGRPVAASKALERFPANRDAGASRDGTVGDPDPSPTVLDTTATGNAGGTGRQHPTRRNGTRAVRRHGNLRLDRTDPALGKRGGQAPAERDWTGPRGATATAVPGNTGHHLRRRKHRRLPASRRTRRHRDESPVLALPQGARAPSPTATPDTYEPRTRCCARGGGW